MNYQAAIERAVSETTTLENLGTIPEYIPELKHVDPTSFGVHLQTTDGAHMAYGDSNVAFSIQSISKVLSLTLAYQLKDEILWQRVGVEPSGTAFNSLVQLEYEKGIPRNPLINAGAIVICDVLISELNEPKKDLLSFIRKIACHNTINFDQEIVDSERSLSFRNAALINLMKNFGNIHNDIEEVLDFYFNLCSIKMTCTELAQAFLFLANGGKDPVCNEQIISTSKSKRINAIMQLCGFYDEAGEFSFKVGLPGKSGVGGGIVAILPGKYAVAVWSPKLNEKGNSYLGTIFLEKFTTLSNHSIF